MRRICKSTDGQAPGAFNALTTTGWDLLTIGAATEQETSSALGMLSIIQEQSELRNR